MIIPDKIIRTHRRSLVLKISDKGELIVRAPLRLSYDKIYMFIKEKEKWISTKQNEVLNKQNINKDIINYNSIQFLGKKYNINFINGLKKIELSDKSLLIPFKYKEDFVQKIKLWLTNNAKKILFERLEYFADIMQLDYSKVSLCNSKTKWGSCSSLREIKLNFRLIMLPHKVLDYVLIHELAHIIEMNHSKNFYNVISIIMPSYKIQQKYLKDNGYLLGLFR